MQCTAKSCIRIPTKENLVLKNLLDKLVKKDVVIGVVGLRYVGLPLMLIGIKLSVKIME